MLAPDLASVSEGDPVSKEKWGENDTADPLASTYGLMHTHTHLHTHMCIHYTHTAHTDNNIHSPSHTKNNNNGAHLKL